MKNLLKDDDAVSELIGAILLLAIAVIFLGLVQTYQVPEWNRKVESDHLVEVYDDFLKLKTNIEDSVVNDFPKATVIHMGASYPSRVVFRNPTQSSAGELSLKNDRWIRVDYTTQTSTTMFDEDYETPGNVVLVSYNGVNGSTQHSSPTNVSVGTTAYNGTYALTISGNDWQEQAFTPFTLTANTTMSVWIRGDTEAEIQAIGVAYGTGSSRHSLLYRLWGTQENLTDTNWINSPYQDMYSIDSNWHQYEFPIGADWNSKWGSYESVDRIVYIQDNDAAPSTGRIYFDDLTIKNVIESNVSFNYTTSTISFSPNYFYFHNSPTLVYEHGLSIQNYSWDNYSYTEMPQSMVSGDGVNIIWTNATESTFGSPDPRTLVAKYIEGTSTSVEATNLSLTIYTSYPELWNNSLSHVENITFSIDGNNVTVNYTSNLAVDILVKGSEISFSRGTSSTATVTPTPTPTPGPDTTPPASVTGLSNNTYAQTYINWVWTNPNDSDFSHVMVYIDSVWKTNTSSPSYNASGFSASESHTISTRTVDATGNINGTPVSHTATTAPEPPTTRTYDATDGRSYFRAYGTYSDNWNDLNGEGGTLATLPSECDTEVSDVAADAYTRLSYSDATGGDSDSNRYINPDESGGDESTMIIHFWIDESVSSIDELSFTWEGYGDGSHTLRLYVFNYDTNNWDGGETGYKDSDSGNADFLLEWSATSGIDSYINGNDQLAFLILDASASENSFHDYAKLEVSA
ncbi:MAG: hypothetical protein SVM80_00465 [Halobacteriota archaeon]|nr:hypothetical protein [Halobacteriota archaeon]